MAKYIDGRDDAYDKRTITASHYPFSVILMISRCLLSNKKSLKLRKGKSEVIIWRTDKTIAKRKGTKRQIMVNNTLQRSLVNMEKRQIKQSENVLLHKEITKEVPMNQHNWIGRYSSKNAT